jgi:hypothetical protein
LEFGIMFRGTKLGEGQLVCAEAPTLGWRNFLWIQLEGSRSYRVFILASIKLSRILLEDGGLNKKWISFKDNGSSHWLKEIVLKL